ncbi:filamentous hemagglutinin N-terminal domain-containing protein [Pseudomonas syringae]|uniref:two-partner secretion domain-containing protein n=8 Tax=Pseudomonas syringae group TaxID=136849 RepID=UPI002364CF9F|nr:filamentous hemagglutinin N-terminal domain-containing protein [Pseudomonas syringae]GKQ44553.1 filamentous hemagglutinin N-terminal domain-containing protein [Pseudomonas syringae pv. theae]
MDVHQLALLARQPSAVLTERRSFWGMPKRGLALILANAMFWQPLLVQAEGIVVSGPNTSLSQAGNGVPIVNIATPNASGLSHNQYQQFNVESQGVILNNSTNQTQNTQLGGIIVGNSNLRGTAATTILNEVVGANASQLKGYTEVAGQAARVIVANPYGISCNGCGFINTPQVTLTTGKPVLDANGQLQRFDVQGGSITIDGVGLNADNVDQFDIITRSAKINAELHAKRLNIIAGRNDVDAQTLNATALADDGSAKPELAIDSSALGGMYAGTIRLVGTEAGVGVRLAGNLAASGGDIQIDANGHLNVMQTAASGAVTVKANSAEVNGPVYAGSSLAVTTAGDLVTRQNVAARDALTLSAGAQLNNSAVIEAGVNADNSRNGSGDVTLSANGLSNSGSITASRALQATVSQTLNNQGATLNGQASTRIAAAAIDNRQSGRILSQSGSVDINASQVLNSQSGLISSSGSLTITAGSLDNSQQGKLSSSSVLSARISGQFLNQLGLVSANGDLLLNAATLDNRSAEISSLGNLTSTVGQFNNSEKGRLLANGSLQLTSDNLNNQNGSLAGQQNVQLTLGQLTNTGNGSVYGKNNLNLTLSGALNNDQGVLRSDGTLDVRAASLSNNSGSTTSAGAASVSTSGAVVSRGGQILSDAGLTLISGSLDNSQSGRIAGNGVVLSTGAFDNQRSGNLSSTGTLQLTAAQINNSDAGRIASAMALTAVVTGLNQTNDGRLYSNSDVSLDLSNGLLTNQGGLINAPGQLVLKNLNVVNNQSGKFSSANGFTLAATALDNTDGSILSDKALFVRVNQLLTNLRGLVSATGLDLTAGSLNNRNGEISSLGNLTANIGQFDNREKGRLLANGALLLTADGLNNLNGVVSGQQGVQLNLGQLNNTGAGSLYAKSSLGLNVNGTLNNDQGVVRSDGTMDLKAAGLANTNGSVTSAGTGVLNFNGAVVNQGGQLVSDAQLTLTSGSLDNSQRGRIAGNGVVLSTGAFNNQQGGSLSSTGALRLTAGQVDNSAAGRIASAMALTAVVTGLNQTNDGRLYSNSDVSLDMSNGLLTNQGGLINAPGQLLLKNLSVVNNQSGKISSANGFTLAATSLDNTDGSILSDKALVVRVNQLLTNLRGLVSATGLDLTAGSLNNRNAELSSLGNLTANIGQFDNREKGRLLANGALLLTADGLNNLNGVVSGQQGVQLNLGQLNNTGAGSLYAKSSLGLNVSGTLNNDQGVVRSDGTMDLKAAGLANTNGSVTSAGTGVLNFNGVVVNQGGQLVSDAQLTLTSGSLDNSQRGRIAGNGVVLSTGAFDNQHSGNLSSTVTLQLTAAQVNNSDAGRIASAMALTAVVTGLNQTNDGRLYSNTDVSLDLSNGLLNNQSGQISAPGQLLLKNLNVVNNQSGKISSANGFTLAATSLDNTEGSLLSDKALVVRINQWLTNLRGQISANGVTLSAATLDNRNAELSSLGNLTANIGQFDNREKGRLLANGALLLTADGLNNLNGVVSGQQGVQLNLGQLTNTTGGSIYAKSSLGLAVSGALNNDQGVLRSDGSLTLRAASLTNNAGSISSAGVASINVDGDVVNRGGQVLSDATLTLTSASLDNSQSGRIASKGLTLTTGAFDNHQDGRLTSTGELQLNAGLVNNSDAGRIASAMALTAVVTGLNQTRDGRLYSNSDVSLDLSNGVLTNQGGLINAPGQLLLKNLTSVSNRQGEISSANGFTLAATSLDNTEGSLLSDKALVVRINQWLTNLRGKISANGVNLSAATLDNRNAELSSLSTLTATLGEFDNTDKGRLLANGALLLTADTLNNQNGIVSGQQDVQLNLGQLSNTGAGSVYAKNRLGLTLTGALNNDQGVLRSDGALDLKAASLANTGGSVTSAGVSTLATDAAVVNQGGQILSDATLTLTSASLDNSQSGRIASNGLALTTGAFDNHQDGRLISTGTLQLNAGQVNNSDAGRIASAMALTAVVTGLDQTNEGRLYGNGDVSLDLSNGVLTNQGGQLSAPGQLLLKNLSSVNNRSGKISSANGFTLAATTLDNTAGSVISDKALIVRIDQLLTNLRGLISATGVELNAATLDNRNAELSSLGKLTATVGQFDNSGKGRLLANGALLLTADNLNNQGAGAVSGQQEVQLTLGQLTNIGSGSVYAKNTLGLTVSGALNNHQGVVRSDGTLDVSGASLANTAGSITSSGVSVLKVDGAVVNRGGQILSDSTLSLSSASLDNSQNGRIAGKGVKLVTGAFDNQQGGRLTSTGTLKIDAGQVNNSDAGRIASAMALTAVVTGLDQSNDGRLYGNGDVSLDLSKGVLKNQGGLITAPGQLLLKNLTSVNNQSGEISSAKGFTLAATSLDNTAGSVLSDNALIVRVDQLLTNLRGLVSGNGIDLTANELNNQSGSVSSDADLLLTIAGTLANQKGELTSAGNTTLSALTLANANGQVMADRFLKLVITDAIDNQAGTLGAGKGADIRAVSLDNRQAGALVTDGQLDLTLSGALDNRASGSLQAKGLMNLTSQTLDNRGGRITAQNLLVVRSASVDNRGGAIRAEKGLQLFVDALDNSQTGLSTAQKGLINSNAGLELVGTRLDNQNGLLNAAGLMQLQADSVLNGSGRIASQADLVAHIGGLTQQGGELVAQGNLTLTGDTLDNQSGGLVGSTKALNIDVADIDNKAGELSSQIGVEIIAQTLDNSNGGKVLAGTALGLTVARVINLNKGLLFGNTLHLDGTRLDNAGGTLASQQDLNIGLSGALDNTGGLLSSESAMTVSAASLQNAAGSLSSADALSVTTTGALSNQAGSITTDAALTLTSASLDNSKAGKLSGKGATQVTTGTFDNSQNGRLTSSDTLRLTAGKVINQNAGRIASALALTASVTSLDQQAGELFSNTSLSLDLNNGQLNNQGGLINASGVLLLKNLNGVANQNGEISSAQAFSLNASSLDNSGGKLLSSQALTLMVNKALSNLKGNISGAALSINSDSLDNTEGMISSRSGLDVTVNTALTNAQGTLIGDGNVNLSAATANNRLGQLASKQNLDAQIGNLQQQNGQMLAQGTLTLRGDALDNRQNGFIGATQALAINVTNIDNRGGELSSQDTMTLTGQQLNNSDKGQVLAQKALTLNIAQTTNRGNGLLSSQAGLTLIGSTLDNTGGALSALKALGIDLSAALDNSQGLISGEDILTLNAGSLTNTAGSVSSAANLTLDSTGAISNQGGKLVTDGALKLTSTRLDNSQRGTISGKGLLTLKTGNFDNSQNGRVSSNDRLELTSAQLTNSSGGSIGSSQALTASVSRLSQQGGKLFSNTSLSLDLNNGQLDNQNGLINAPGALVLKNVNEVLNQNGEISSAQAFTVNAQQLNNNGGKLLSNQLLTLRIARALNNVKGMIAAAGVDAVVNTLDNTGGTLTSRNDLGLTVTGLLTNRDNGLINATQALKVGAASLDNQNGQVLGGTGLILNATSINNTAKGLINSTGTLNLTAGSLDAGNGGEVSATRDMTLVLNALSLNGGRVMGDAGLSIDMVGNDLNNLGGLITADGQLTFSRLRDLNNQSGEVSSANSFTLNGRTLDNSSGKLISSNVLTVGATNLLNQNGLISGWQGLNVSGNRLDNRNSGTLSSRSGNLVTTLTGELLNGGNGALVSQNTLSVTADSLDNSGGILSSGTGQTLTVSGVLNNSQNGLIDSGAGLVVNANALNNAAGNMTAQQDVSFGGSSLDNSAGNLSSKGAMTLDLLGSLTNTGGKLASGGTLLLRRSTAINNQAGQLISQSLMTLNTSGQLDNSNRGTVAANNTLTVVASGNVLNDADGLIYSQSADAHVQAASLSNVRGTVQSVGALRVDVAGDINNQNGRIIAQGGDLNVSAANLYSQGGVLSSLQGLFTANVTGVLKNGYDANRQGGVIQAQRLNLTALSSFDNYGGRVSARTGEALINTASFDNRNGGLYAKGLVRVTGGNFDNSGDNDGQIAGGQVELNLSGALNNRFGIIESDSTLAVTAASLDNQTGQLRALGGGGATNFQIGNLFDNRNGTLESANSDLILNAGSFLNGGGSLLHTGNGTFDISTANLTNAGGSIVTRGGLTLAADSWTNSNVIQAGRLTVNVNNFSQTASGQLLASTSFVGNGGNWNNDGLIASDGSLSLNLGGTYGGNGRLSSVGTLGLSAAQVNLNAASTIAGGGDTSVSVGGQLSNVGRLTSATNLTVNAGSINNQGTLGSGQALTVTTGSLVNDRGLIFSGSNMSLRVSSLNNSYANIYSLGNLTIDRNGQGGLADSIVNSSASIQSDGSMSLAASTIKNIRALLTTSNGGIYTARIDEGACNREFYNNDCGGGKATHTWEITQREKLEVTAASAASGITAGGNLNINGGDLFNQSSTIITSGNFTAALNNLNNTGIEASDTETVRVYRSARTSDASAWTNAASDFTEKYWFTSGGYNANNLSGLEPAMADFIAITETEMPEFRKVTQLSNGDQSYSAIIQAGGSVNVNAQNNIGNNVVRAGYSYVSGGSRTDTNAPGSQFSTRITVNQQLPPDLAQQQVNPLSLPGFSLPTGQNGLFRLSGQSGTAAAVAQPVGLPQSWTMGSAAVSVAQREQTVSDAQASTVQIGSVGQISIATRQLASVTRQSAGVSANASAFDTSAPGAAPIGGLVLPGHTSDSAGVTSVDSVTGIATGNQGSGALLPVQNAGSTSGLPVITAISSGNSAAQNAGRVQGTQVNQAGQVVNGTQGSLVSAVNQATTGAQSGTTAAVTQVVVNAQGGQVIAPVRNPVATQGGPLVTSVGNPAVSQGVSVTAPVRNTLAAQGGPVTAAVLNGASTSTTAPNTSTQPVTVAQASTITPVVSAAAQTVTRVEGLPSSNFVSKPQKYLIETNPVLTELKQFMSSDYLLAGLGYDPEVSAKRLGDGLYEQRLVQQAVVARTGQAFIDGQTSNEAQFKYLMNNAIASKQQLNLAVGVSLSSQQVAALTHDIVWLEEHEVNGEMVLVPVLYLAQADNRLGPTGALIAGNDVSLIAGQNLDNVGTLRAANNLSAAAGNDLVNSGLIEAGNRLDLLAGNDLINKAGGIIAGRDVTLTAIRGDVINERTVTSHQSAADDATWRKDFADSAARIEAANDMSLQAGRDVKNTGGVLQAGRDLSFEAGRDVTLDSAQTEDGQTRGANSSNSSITQLGSTVSAGRDLTAQAGRDINVIASSIDAKRDIAMAATENLTLSSAADEQHSYGKSKKVTEQEDHVSQVSADLKAGGSVALQAGQNLAVISSRITAGKEAYLVAGENLDILAAQDSDYSLYDMKKKGSFGAKKTQRDEVTDVKNIGSEITTGGDLLLSSGGDQKYQAAKLESGKDLTIESGGAVTFEGVKDLHQESHEKSKSDLAWNSSKGKGNTDETLRQSELVAKGEVAIRAVQGLKIDIKQIDQQSVSQTIDAMVKADPQLAWLKEAELRGDVDWRQVKEVHDSFKYDNSSLGQGAMLAIIIIVTVLTAGAGTFAAAGTAAGSAATGAATAAGVSATTAATIGTAANAAAVASLTSITAQGVVSTINNKGNLGAALKDTFSSDSLKSAAISGLTAGFTEGVIDPQLGGTTKPFNSLTKGFDLSTWGGAGGFALHAGAQGLASGAINTAVNGGSLGDNLANGLVSQAGNVAAALGFYQVGSFADQKFTEAALAGDVSGKAMWAEGGIGRTTLHALMGGAVSSATGGDFTTGAVAAGASQAMAGTLNEVFKNNPEYRQAAAQIVGLTAAGLAGGDVEKAAWVSAVADQYNRQLHPTEIPLLEKQSSSLAQEANISPAEAEKRLAQALAYYTDKDWNSALAAKGVVPDALTLKHLGIALSPLADSYAAVGDVPVVAGSKSYTPAETVALITEYRNTHTAEYADPSINNLNMQGAYAGDPEYKYADFYRKNLAVNTGFLSAVSGNLAGIAQGSGGALSDSLGSAWALMSDPVGVSEQAANGLMGLSKNPWGSFKNSVEASQTKEAMATIYDMQGNTAASAAIRAKSDLEFALNFLPANRAKTLAELGAGRKFAMDGPCCFAAGTMVSTPDGERAIDTLKVGDIVWSKPEGGGKPFAAAILATHIRTDQPIYRLKLKGKQENGQAEDETLLVTPGHPFYVPAQHGFVPVIDLKPGDRLQSLADGASENTSSEVESLELYLPVGKTYNLTVDVGHTFYVGKLKTWVHNTGPCELPEGYFGAASGNGAKAVGTALETTNPVAVSGSRAIDKAQSYEGGVRGMYGGNSVFEERQFRTVVDGKIVNGVADDVAVIGGKKTAIEAKFVDDWGSSLRNPASPSGSKPWSVAEQTKMVDQAKKYSSGFDGGAIYHTNSPELASYYSKIFTDAGITKFKFVITPAAK